MLFTKALRLGPGRTVAFVGAGGKSTVLGCLASEASLRFPVILTTTTHLALEQSNLAESHIVLKPDTDWDTVPSELKRHRSVLVTGQQMAEEPRWTSPGEINLSRLHDLAQQSGAALIVEADGARGKPFKAPADHEPLVPNFTNTFVPVIGASIFGRRLSDEWVHRPERVGDLLDLAEGGVLTPERVARVVGSRAGGLKGRPPMAEVRVLINQVDSGDRRDPAMRCAKDLLGKDDVRAVLLGSASSEHLVHEVRGRVAGVVLAAGGSKRIGRPKLLEPWKGEPIIRYAVRGALDGGLSPVVVVLGSSAAAMAQAIDDLPVTIELNNAWEAGQSTSLRLGLSAIRARSEAVVFLLGDMPLVKPDLIRRLVDRHASSLDPIVAPMAEGRRGNPVLFDRSTFDALAQVRGDQGGRAIFDQFDVQAVDADASGFFDLDTQEDVDRLQQKQ
jgi:molybdenum cofactor cytidylyltransferase